MGGLGLVLLLLPYPKSRMRLARGLLKAGLLSASKISLAREFLPSGLGLSEGDRSCDAPVSSNSVGNPGAVTPAIEMPFAGSEEAVGSFVRDP